MGRGVIGIEGDRLAEMALGLVPVPVVVLDDQRQGSMGFGQRGVEGEPPEGGSAGPGYQLLGRPDRVDGAENVGLGQRGPAPGEPGITLDGLLEQGGSSPNVAIGPLVEQVLSPEVEIVRIGSRRRSGRSTPGW